VAQVSLASGGFDDVASVGGAQDVTRPSVAFPVLGVTALAGSILLAVLRVPGWGPFVGYLLAPLGVIIALVLAVLERNRNTANPNFEQTLARLYLRVLTGMAIVSLGPAWFHSLQIARQVTLWLQ
jgi:hypothetical protein